MADRPLAQRAAPMRATTRIALMLDLGAVIDQCATTPAVRTAPPKLGVEGVQDLATDTTDLLIAEQRDDVVPDKALIALARGRFDAGDLQVALHQLRDGRRRMSLAARVELGEQLRADLLRLRGRLRAGGDDLLEAVPPLRDRVDPGVDAHP